MKTNKHPVLTVNGQEWTLRTVEELTVIGVDADKENDSNECIVIDPDTFTILLPPSYDMQDLGVAVFKILSREFTPDSEGGEQ